MIRLIVKVLFKKFLGDIIYTEKREQDDNVLVKAINYVSTDTDFLAVKYDYRGNVQYSTMISKLCTCSHRSEFILQVLEDALKVETNKQVMILGHNRNLLVYLHDAIESRKIAMNLQNNTKQNKFSVKSAKAEHIEKKELDITDEKFQDDKKVSSKMIIQVGSFKNEDNANILVQKLENFNAFLQKNFVKENFFYRVRIGPFNDFSNAKNTLNKLFSLGFYNSKIIPNYE